MKKTLNNASEQGDGAQGSGRDQQDGDQTAMTADPMLRAADQASELLKAMANRHRLLILCKLVQGEQSVGQLAAFLDIRDSTVSQHLALLRRDRLIAGRRDGQTIWYRIESETARDVVKVLYDAYCAKLEATA